jgi:ATP-binding cassette subfamily D (ALD) long-chain fatty acid import protein
MKHYLGEEGEGPDGKVYYKLCKLSPFLFLNANCSLANLDDRIKNPDQSESLLPSKACHDHFTG